MRGLLGFFFALTCLTGFPGLAGAETTAPSSTSVEVTVEYGQTLVVYSATVVATLKSEGKPVTGRSVTFDVMSGPHTGAPKVTSKTDSKGQARATYPGDGNLGTDTVRVTVLEGGSPSDPASPLTVSRDCSVRWKALDPCFQEGGNAFLCIFLYMSQVIAEEGLQCAAPAYGGAAQMAMRTAPEAEHEILELMRGVRDKILKRDAAGQHLVDLWSAHSAELVRLGLESPPLLIEMHDFVHRNRDLLRDLVAGGEGRIGGGDLEGLRATLDRFAARGSPELREAIAEVERTLADPELLRQFGVRVE